MEDYHEEEIKAAVAGIGLDESLVNYALKSYGLDRFPIKGLNREESSKLIEALLRINEKEIKLSKPKLVRRKNKGYQTEREREIKNTEERVEYLMRLLGIKRDGFFGGMFGRNKKIIPINDLERYFKEAGLEFLEPLLDLSLPARNTPESMSFKKVKEITGEEAYRVTCYFG